MEITIIEILLLWMVKLDNLVFKIRLSVLWLIGALNSVFAMLLSFYESGVIEQIIVGELEGTKLTPGLLLLFAVFFLIPLTMALLSLTLKDSLNRRVNMILGIILAGLSLIELYQQIVIQSAWAILLSVVAGFVPALVFWYAWKWPK
jgi:hypothetical protein